MCHNPRVSRAYTFPIEQSIYDNYARDFQPLCFVRFFFVPYAICILSSITAMSNSCLGAVV